MIFSGALRAALLLLPAVSILAPARPSPVEETTAAGAPYERDFVLQARADALLSLFDAMPPVPVYVTERPIAPAGDSTARGVAYTECAGHETPSIVVKKSFYRKTNRRQVDNILKHELTHAWLCRQRLMSGHDERFRRKFEAVGGFGN